MEFPRERRITVHLIDDTDHTMVVSEIRISEGIVTFGRDDGSGWYEFLSAPMDSIISWDYM